MRYNLTTYLRVKNKYNEKKELGLCVTAGCDNKAEPNKVSCKSCMEKQRARYHKQKKTLLDQMISASKDRITMKNKNTISISGFITENFSGMKHGEKVNHKQNHAFFFLDKSSKQKLPFIIMGQTFIDKKELQKEVNEILKGYTDKYLLKQTIAQTLVKRYPNVSTIAFSRELTEMIPKENIVLKEGSIVVYKIPDSL